MNKDLELAGRMFPESQRRESLHRELLSKEGDRGDSLFQRTQS